MGRKSHFNERLLSNIRVLDNGCWQWVGRKNLRGYGMIPHKGRTRPAHRAVYEFFNHCVVPKHLQMDHLCRVPSCVNPDHLEPVTPRENTLRGNTAARFNAEKLTCHRGHEFTSENTTVKNGHRICKACRRIYNNEIYQRRYSAQVNDGLCWLTRKRRGLPIERGARGRRAASN